MHAQHSLDFSWLNPSTTLFFDVTTEFRKKMDAWAIIVLAFLGCVNGDKRYPIDIKPYCKLGCDTQTGNKIPTTVCKFKCEVSNNCKDLRTLPFSQKERQYQLDQHNKYRQKVASGSDTRGDNGAASNMMVFNYEKELEVPAMCWGMQCFWGHDQCRMTPKFPIVVGQNLHEATTQQDSAAILNISTMGAVSGWYEEIKYTTKARLEKFDGEFSAEEQKAGVMIGHYTQMVWAETKYVGCARVAYKRNVGVGQWLNVSYILCNYAPTGNYGGEKVYEFGKPASKCPAGTKPNAKYPALCGVLKKVEADKPAKGAAAGADISECLFMLLGVIGFIAVDALV